MSGKNHTDFNTTRFQEEVFKALNPGGKYTSTQAQVARRLGVSKSSVSDAVKKLEKLGFIRKRFGVTRDIFYEKGKHASIIEYHIKMRKIDDERNNFTDDRGNTYKLPDRPMYTPTFRVHVNGGWLKFRVLVQGQVEDIETKDCPKPYALFKGSKPWHTKGSWNWQTAFNPDPHEHLTKIRFQCTYNGNKYLYIVPNDAIVTADQLRSDNDNFHVFEPCYSSILYWLELNARWEFPKDDNGKYIVENKDSGLQIEYGFDGLVTEALEELVGRNIGIPGVTDLWEDNSDGAQNGDREMETGKSGIAKFADRVPRLCDDVDNILARVEKLEEVNGLVREDDSSDDCPRDIGSDEAKVRKLYNREERRQMKSCDKSEKMAYLEDCRIDEEDCYYMRHIDTAYEQKKLDEYRCYEQDMAYERERNEMYRNQKEV